MLFFRMCRSLMSSGYTSEVIDYPDGVYTELANGSGVSIIKVVPEVKIVIGSEDILITPPVHLKLIRAHLSINEQTRILFWVLHPYNLVRVLPFIYPDLQYSNRKLLRLLQSTIFQRHFKRSKELICISYSNKGICFMDGESLEVTSTFFNIILSQVKFLPIPVISHIETAKQSKLHRRDQSTIRLCWISRLADFKVNILKHVLSDLANYSINSDISFEFSIIGAGPKLKDLKDFCSKLGGKVDFQFAGQLSAPDLKDHLLAEVDCLFAMGTSALEGGANGIPTCLVDAFYGKVPSGYKYKWLHETKDYSLGRILDGRQLPAENRHTFVNLMTMLTGKAEEIGFACKSYVDMNHDIDVITRNLIGVLENNENHFSKIKHLLY
jgi:hypothetical protein